MPVLDELRCGTVAAAERGRPGCGAELCSHRAPRQHTLVARVLEDVHLHLYAVFRDAYRVAVTADSFMRGASADSWLVGPVVSGAEPADAVGAPAEVCPAMIEVLAWLEDRVGCPVQPDAILAAHSFIELQALHAERVAFADGEAGVPGAR